MSQFLPVQADKEDREKLNVLYFAWLAIHAQTSNSSRYKTWRISCDFFSRTQDNKDYQVKLTTGSNNYWSWNKSHRRAFSKNTYRPKIYVPRLRKNNLLRSCTFLFRTVLNPLRTSFCKLIFKVFHIAYQNALKFFERWLFSSHEFGRRIFVTWCPTVCDIINLNLEFGLLTGGKDGRSYKTPRNQSYCIVVLYQLQILLCWFQYREIDVEIFNRFKIPEARGYEKVTAT